MGLPPRGACRRREPGVKQPRRHSQRRGALSHRKFAAHFLTWNRLNACSRRKENVQTADEALDMAKANLGAGLGTQLDILQAASDVTRTRTTRLGAIYLHNVAIARLARACASSAEALDFGSKIKNAKNENRNAAQALDVARPPAKLSQR